MDFYLLAVIVFVILVIVFIYIDRKNYVRESILLLRKTKKGRGILNNISKSCPNFWKYVGIVGVIVGFLISIWTVYLLIDLTIINFTIETPIQGIGLVLPSPTAEPVVGPGFYGVPLFYWIIAIVVLMLVHEGSHGIMALRDKVKIKSIGWGVFIVIPLAFVEIDEKHLEKKGKWAQLRVYGAGSFANFVTAFVCLIIMISVFTPLYQPAGVRFTGLMEGYPAEKVNLTGIIVGIDDYQIQTVEDLNAALIEAGVGKEISVYTNVSGDINEFRLTTVKDPDKGSEKGFIGIAFAGSPNARMLKPEASYLEGLIVFFEGMFYWLFLINFGVGAFNLLPIRGLDGGKMWEIFALRLMERKKKRLSLMKQKKREERAKSIMNYATWAMLFILALNFLLIFRVF